MNNDHVIVVAREGHIGTRPWLQYLIIRDESVTLLEMEPAPLGGWNVVSILVQGEAEWPRMKAHEIWRFKEEQGRHLSAALGQPDRRVIDNAVIDNVLRLEAKYRPQAVAGFTVRVRRGE